MKKKKLAALADELAKVNTQIGELALSVETDLTVLRKKVEGMDHLLVQVEKISAELKALTKKA